jgi:hypothetical protein
MTKDHISDLAHKVKNGSATPEEKATLLKEINKSIAELNDLTKDIVGSMKDEVKL